MSNMSINTIIMTCKFYILKCARLKKQLKFFEYESYLTKIYNRKTSRMTYTEKIYHE